jgi:hypothetical protein
MPGSSMFNSKPFCVDHSKQQLAAQGLMLEKHLNFI